MQYRPSPLWAMLTAATLIHGWSVASQAQVIPELDVPGVPGNDAASDDSCLASDEPFVQRAELVDGDVRPGRRLLLRFVQISDEHILDDDGQAVNGGSFLDPLLPELSSAQRYQDEYTDEVLNAAIANINRCHDAAPVELVLATGDNTDLATVAEVRRLIGNMDGEPGDRMSAFEAACRAGLAEGTPEAAVRFQCTRFTGRLVADTQTPDPRIDNPLYQVPATRTALMLADTERAAVTGRDADGDTDPARQTANRAPGMPAHLRCDADEEGCGNHRLDVPYYVAFGNHDGYIRGTLVTEPGVQEASFTTGRHYMRQPHEFIDEFFRTRPEPGPVGHGFNHVESDRMNDGDGRNDGYYAFDSADGRFRMIVLDTIFDGVDPRFPTDELRNPFALADGTIDAEQFAWLRAELDAAEAEGRPVLVFSHHPDVSFAEFGTFGDLVPVEVTAAELDAELASHPNVIAWFAGHTHRNRIRAFVVGDGTGSNGDISAPVECTRPGACRGFWQIETSSLIDHPQEARLVEIYDHRDGTGSIRLTILEHDFERSRRLAEADDRCQFYATEQDDTERVITEADISAICSGGEGRPGQAEDRNVELFFPMPGR